MPEMPEKPVSGMKGKAFPMPGLPCLFRKQGKTGKSGGPEGRPLFLSEHNAMRHTEFCPQGSALGYVWTVADYHRLANEHRPTDGAALAREVLRLLADGLTAQDAAVHLRLPLAWVLEVASRGAPDAC